MATLETIRRITVQGRTTGVAEATQALTALDRAQTKVAQTADGVAVATDRSARRQVSVARQYENLQSKVDLAFRAQRQFQREMTLVNAAHEQGVIGAGEQARMVDVLAERYKVVTQAMSRHNAEQERAAAVSRRVNELTGVAGRSDSASRADDIVAYGAELDRLRARFDPLFAAGQRYQAVLQEISNAERVGAVSASIAMQARQKETEEYNRQIAKLNGVAEARKRAAQAMVDQQTITPDRGADIAAYGRQLDDLRAKYNPLFAAGRQYKQALAEINMAARVGAISESERAEALTNTKIGFIQQVNAIKGYNDTLGATEKAGQRAAAGTGLARHELINLSRQAQDVGVSLASGQSPFIVLVQQGTQIADVFAASDGTVRGFFNQLKSGLVSIITPARLAVAGVLAVAAAGAAIYSSWRSSILVLDDLAQQARVTAREMYTLQQVAAGKGIDSAQFGQGMQGFAEQVYQAQNGMGSLLETMRANGKEASSYGEYLEQAADIIRGLPNMQARLNVLQQMGLPATAQFARFMAQGGDAIREAAEQADRFGNVADEAMIRRAREFSESWNQGVARLKSGFMSFFMDAIQMFERLSSAGTAALIKIASFLPQAIRPDIARNILRYSMENNAGSRLTSDEAGRYYDAVGIRDQKGDGGGVDPAVLKNQLQLEQQRISMLGQLATVSEQVRAKEIQIQLARLNGVNITQRQADAILNLTRVEAEGARLATLIQNGVATAEQMRAQKLRELNIEITRGTLTTQQAAVAQQAYEKTIRETVEQMEIYRAALPGLKQLELSSANFGRLVDDTAVSSLNSVSSSLVDMATGAKSASEGFADMGKAIQRAITEMIIKMTVILPLARSLQSVLGGAGIGGGLMNILGGGGAAGVGNPGILGTIYHSGGIVGEGGNQRYVHPAYFDDAPRMHSGGIAGGLAPDEVPAILQRGERVIPRGQSAGGQPIVQVKVINQSALAQPEVRQDQNGGIEVVVRDMVRGVMAEDAASNGPISKTMMARSTGFGGR